MHGDGGVKLEAVFSGVRKVREEREALCKSTALGKVGVKLLADDSFGAVLGDRRNESEWGRRSGIGDEVGAEGVAVIAETTEDIKNGAVGLNNVIAEAAAINLAKIEVWSSLVS